LTGFQLDIQVIAVESIFNIRGQKFNAREDGSIDRRDNKPSLQDRDERKGVAASHISLKKRIQEANKSFPSPNEHLIIA